jgi:transcriptional regulator with XRE-family HTH domain
MFRLGIMNSSNTMSKSKNRTQANDLGALLRQWRGARNMSQMEASLEAGVSQRHLSFIEIGRSVPSRETLIGIAEALEIPYRDRNSLLLAAGYAPMYEDAGWDEQDLRSVTEALKRMLRQHEPFPALVMDRYWNVLQTNTAAPRFFNSFVDLSARPQPRNLLHLMFDPAGMRSFIANWEEVARTLIQRVYRESVGRVMDEKSQDLISALLAYPGTKPEWRNSPVQSAPSDLPVIPIRFMKDGETLSYFSMLTTLATPQAIATQELRIESMFPMDGATETRHARIMNQGQNVDH